MKPVALAGVPVGVGAERGLVTANSDRVAETAIGVPMTSTLVAAIPTLFCDVGVLRRVVP